jgi:putative membrane protein
VYEICGRFAPVSPLTDQQIGGLIIWIPGTVFLVTIAILVLRRILHQEYAAQTAPVPRT